MKEEQELQEQALEKKKKNLAVSWLPGKTRQPKQITITYTTWGYARCHWEDLDTTGTRYQSNTESLVYTYTSMANGLLNDALWLVNELSSPAAMCSLWSVSKGANIGGWLHLSFIRKARQHKEPGHQQPCLWPASMPNFVHLAMHGKVCSWQHIQDSMIH